MEIKGTPGVKGAEGHKGISEYANNNSCDLPYRNRTRELLSELLISVAILLLVLVFGTALAYVLIKF